MTAWFVPCVPYRMLTDDAAVGERSCPYCTRSRAVPPSATARGGSSKSCLSDHIWTEVLAMASRTAQALWSVLSTEMWQTDVRSRLVNWVPRRRCQAVTGFSAHTPGTPSSSCTEKIITVLATGPLAVRPPRVPRGRREYAAAQRRVRSLRKFLAGASTPCRQRPRQLLDRQGRVAEQFMEAAWHPA